MPCFLSSESEPKKLRLNKVSELIHNSDAVKKNPPQYARVSVYFQEIIDTGDGDDDYELVPQTECVVERLARTDNSSQYKLNGKNCSFKGVAAYLGSKGIDLDNNRFLILQGEVEMISMMPPKGKTENDEGLLEYLEDIIGSNKFVEETNLAAAKVEALSEQRQEKLNRVKAVEKEKDNLEGAKVEAEALLGKEREIRRKKNILYQINMMQTVKESKKIICDKQCIEEKLELERKQLKLADDRVKEIEDGFAAQKREYDKIHKELIDTKEEFAAYERRDIKIKEEIKHFKAQKKKLEAKVKLEVKKEETAIKSGEEAKTCIPELEAQIEALTADKAREDEKLEEIQEESKGVTDTLRVQLDAKMQELAPVNQERAVKQAAIDTANTEVNLLTDFQNRAKDQLNAAEKELASLDETQAKKRDELRMCNDELAKSTMRIIAAENEEKELARKEVSLAKRNKELMAMTEEAKAALRASGAERSRAVEGILRASRSGGELSKVGILGRLGDLATIPAKYDVAVSTACTMLDHIVVQTTAGAQRCLKFLREHELGRANFIPLDKMSKGAHDRSVETPEGAPRLFELITPSNFAVTPAIYLGVSNTLVAPDLETATRWAYDFSKRWRVVTLDGGLIETSGTMAGGGKSVRKGGMRLANGRPASMAIIDDDGTDLDCKNLEKQAADALEELQLCRKRRKELVDEIRALTKRVKDLSTKPPKLSIDINGCDTTREELTKRIPDLRAQCNLSESEGKRLKELKGNVGKCKSDMAACAMLAAKLEAEVNKLQKAILDAGGPRLKKQQSQCDSVLERLNSAENALTTTKVALTTNLKAAKKAREAKGVAELELEKCMEAGMEKQREFKKMDEEAFTVMQAFEQVKVTESEKRKALDSVTKEVEALKKSQSKIKGIEIELLGQLDAFNKHIHDCENKRLHWEVEINKLRDAAAEDDFDESEDEADPVLPQNIESADSNTEMESSDKKEDPTLKSTAGSSLPTFPFALLEQYDLIEVKGDINTLESEKASLAKNANMGAIAEYRKKEADYLARVSELDTVSEERNAARKAHEELRRLRLDKFMDGFGMITLKLKEMYQMITLGGDAELELVDSLDPFSEGIVFSVRPPKKSWKNIANLSGGEKTLSSLALVFALHHYKPTPLYVMDEIDAALDFKNVSIVANYIKERTKNAQFIIISLRNNMFELADRLVGIYKTNNCTKSVTINPKAFGVAGKGASNGPFLDKTNASVSASEKVQRMALDDSQGSMDL